MRVVEREGGVGGARQRRDPARHLLAQRPAGGAQHQPPRLALGQRVGQEGEAADLADRMPLHHHLAARGDGGEQLLPRTFRLLQPAHQMRGPAIDEARGQPLVQRVGEQVLGLPRPRLPGARVGQPVRPGGDVGPGAHAGEAGHQRVDVAVGAGQRGELGRDPVGRQPPPRASGG